MFMLLLSVAGNETTRNATAWGMLALMQNPDAYAALVEDPSRLDVAADEILRWASPVLHFRRTATEDTEVGGQAIAKDDKVVMWYISANRDEEVFDDPFTFDIDAGPQSPYRLRRRRSPFLPRRQPGPNGAAPHLRRDCAAHP